MTKPDDSKPSEPKIDLPPEKPTVAVKKPDEKPTPPEVAKNEPAKSAPPVSGPEMPPAITPPAAAAVTETKPKPDPPASPPAAAVAKETPAPPSTDLPPVIGLGPAVPAPTANEPPPLKQSDLAALRPRRSSPLWWLRRNRTLRRSNLRPAVPDLLSGLEDQPRSRRTRRPRTRRLPMPPVASASLPAVVAVEPPRTPVTPQPAAPLIPMVEAKPKPPDTLPALETPPRDAETNASSGLRTIPTPWQVPTSGWRRGATPCFRRNQGRRCASTARTGGGGMIRSTRSCTPSSAARISGRSRRATTAQAGITRRFMPRT